MPIQVEGIAPLLKQYDLNLEYSKEISKRAVKVYTDNGSYVLKKLSKNINPYFLESFSILDQQKYSKYVPLVKNRSNQSISQMNGDYYYLMPWLTNETEEERDARHQYLFKEVAELHRRTEKEIKLSNEAAAGHFESFEKHLDETKLYYESFVEECEQKLYLSPFELQAVTYFIEVSRAIDFSKKKLTEWYEKMQEKDSSRMVLTHGKISARHFLYDGEGNGYLTNFENSKYAAPIDDFLFFINRTAKTYPIPSDDCVNWFYTYQKSYPYTDEEMLLFLSYLSYPERICRLIKSYSPKSKSTELEHNKQLVRSYWQFKNIEYFVMKVSEIEEKRKLEAEQTQEQ
ncbi:spore coat protein YsxE [Metabacillus litoralis]|uniref:spore coat protein YsxE n=1 Tax=Metabacillus litoralis TaxID=152268 RepID=UPI001CFDE821|nr:spore coat protein YsxE [Metabacillus litoralis]